MEERLTPKALLRPVQRRLEGTLGAGGQKVLEAFRDHPLPLALTGVGLGWLMWCEMRGERPAAGPSAAEDLASKAQDTAASAVEKARETAAAVPQKLRETARKTSDWFSRTLEEKPMLLAVGALAAGLLAAFIAPMTPKEEEALEKLGEKAAEAVLAEGQEPPAPAAVDDAPPPGL